jgi:hypothetical protein
MSSGRLRSIREFHVNWANPGSSTLGKDEEVVGGLAPIPCHPRAKHHQPNYTLPVPEFVQPVCVYGNGPPNHCNPQKNTVFMAQFIGQQPADLDGTAQPPDPSTGYITEVDDASNIPAAGGVMGDAMRILGTP